jgi:Tol biopolymer transport system component
MYPEFMEDWSADGRLVYVRSTASETSLEIVGADGGSPTVIFRRVNSLPGQQYRLANPRWSSSGSTVVFDIQGQLYAIESNGTNLRHLTADLASTGDLVVVFGTHFWSPDGRTVAFISAGDATTALRAIDVPTGQLRTLVPAAGQRNLMSFCWSSDGSRLSVVLEDLNVAGPTYEREAVITLNADGSGLDTVATQLWLVGAKAPWTKDGRLILVRRTSAAGDFRERLYTASLSGGTMTEVSEVPSSLAFAVSGSPRCER